MSPIKLLRMKIHLIHFENKSATCLLLRSAATDQRPAVIHSLTRRLRSAEHPLAPPLISLFIANPVDANREYDPKQLSVRPSCVLCDIMLQYFALIEYIIASLSPSLCPTGPLVDCNSSIDFNAQFSCYSSTANS